MGKYKQILKIAECGSLTKAAQELGYNQSSLSYITNQIEEELGVKLFRRDRQGTALTEAGSALLIVMNQIEELELTMQKIASSHHIGNVLRIGSFTSVSAEWLPGILNQFYAHYPDVSVSIEQLNCYADLEVKLENGTLDCGFYVGNHQAQYEFCPLYEDAYYVVVSQNNPLAKETVIRSDALPNVPFILPSEGLGNGPVFELVQQLKKNCKLYSQSKDDLVTISLVEQDFGISIMPNLRLKQIPQSKAIHTIAFEEPMQRVIGILSKPKEENSMVTRFFIQVAKSFIQEWQSNTTK